jgi:hypothetical protein
MNTAASPPPQTSANSVFTALGLTVYSCQLFEGTLLELLASAYELLDGTGDGKRYDASLDTLSRKTLGQLLHDFRKRADIRSDIDEQLQIGLEARNFIIHSFAVHVGDDFNDESKFVGYLKLLYDKLAIVIAANSAATAVLEALGKAHTERSERIAGELRATAQALRESVKGHTLPRH